MFSHTIKFNRDGDICRCELYCIITAPIPFHSISLASRSGFSRSSFPPVCSVSRLFFIYNTILSESKFAMCFNVRSYFMKNAISVSYKCVSRIYMHVAKRYSSAPGNRSLFQYYFISHRTHINNIICIYLNCFYWQKVDQSIGYTFLLCPHSGNVFIGKYDENVCVMLLLLLLWRYCTLFLSKSQILHILRMRMQNRSRKSNNNNSREKREKRHRYKMQSN